MEIVENTVRKLCWGQGSVEVELYTAGSWHWSTPTGSDQMLPRFPHPPKQCPRERGFRAVLLPEGHLFSKILHCKEKLIECWRLIGAVASF